MYFLLHLYKTMIFNKNFVPNFISDDIWLYFRQYLKP